MSERKLPTKRNHLVIPVKDELSRKDLIGRRRLGQTELAVDAGQVGTSNATKPRNLGVFDYAHIRVPLPRDLKGSGIFHASRGKSTPEAYFLMRRSSDGFVSASGMFKVAFPWASEAEEKAEKAYLTKLPGTSKEETAGNIWVPPQSALDLGDEYDIRDWIMILLDPTPILNEGKKSVKSPPVFRTEPSSPISPPRSTRQKTPSLKDTPELAPPESPEDLSSRRRALRSASPAKQPAPEEPSKARKIATPKPRSKRARTPAASASVEPEDSTTSSAPTTAKPRKASGRAKKETSVAPEDIPHPSLETVQNKASEIVSEIKTTIQEAVAAPAKEVKSRKRKAAEISEDALETVKESASDAKQEAGDKLAEAGEKIKEVVDRATGETPNKRRRVADIEERKDKVRRRAAVGITLGLAVGAVAPLLTTYLGW